MPLFIILNISILCVAVGYVIVHWRDSYKSQQMFNTTGDVKWIVISKNLHAGMIRSLLATVLLTVCLIVQLYALNG